VLAFVLIGYITVLDCGIFICVVFTAFCETELFMSPCRFPVRDAFAFIIHFKIIFRTVHLRIILVVDQLDAQFLL
jgi:hypothetical protein